MFLDLLHDNFYRKFTKIIFLGYLGDFFYPPGFLCQMTWEYGAEWLVILYWHDRSHLTRGPQAAAFRALCFARSATAHSSQDLNEV